MASDLPLKMPYTASPRTFNGMRDSDAHAHYKITELRDWSFEGPSSWVALESALQCYAIKSSSTLRLKPSPITVAGLALFKDCSPLAVLHVKGQIRTEASQIYYLSYTSSLSQSGTPKRMAAWLGLVGRNHLEMVTRIHLNEKYYLNDGQASRAIQTYCFAISRGGICGMNEAVSHAECVIDGQKSKCCWAQCAQIRSFVPLVIDRGCVW